MMFAIFAKLERGDRDDSGGVDRSKMLYAVCWVRSSYATTATTITAPSAYVDGVCVCYNSNSMRR